MEQKKIYHYQILEIYGNHSNSISPANVGNGVKQPAGSNINWSIKNIYDLAGNVLEWTYEKKNNGYFWRGGCWYASGTSYPVIYRETDNSTITYDGIGFRVRLYIKTEQSQFCKK